MPSVLYVLGVRSDTVGPEFSCSFLCFQKILYLGRVISIQTTLKCLGGFGLEEEEISNDS